MHSSVSGDFLQWLRTFILVTETGNIHRAAESLFVSPSAISHQIRKLESDLGVTLFERKNKGMQLTHEGRLFRASSLPILEAVEKLRSDKAQMSTLAGPIRLTCVNRFAHHLIPDILHFRKLYPKLVFSLDATSPARVLQNVEQGAFDFGVTIHARLPGHLQFSRLRSSSAYLFTPRNNPFGLPDKPSWEEICQLPFIALTLEGYVNPVVSSLPEISHMPKNVVIALTDFILALQLVREGVGVCLAPSLTALESADDYTIFNVDHIFPVGTFGIVTRRDSYMSTQSKAFIAYLKEQYILRNEAIHILFPKDESTSHHQIKA